MEKLEKIRCNDDLETERQVFMMNPIHFCLSLVETWFWETGSRPSLCNPVIAYGRCSTKEERLLTGYTNDPDDPGGETKGGISKKAFPDLNIRALTFNEIAALYLENYWFEMSCDKIPYELSAHVFDAAVLSGPGNSAKFLQRALKMQNVDGVIGPKTIAAIDGYDIGMVINAFREQRADFFERVVAKRPSSIKYLNGWLKRAAKYDPEDIEPEKDGPEFYSEEILTPRAVDAGPYEPPKSFWEVLKERLGR